MSDKIAFCPACGPTADLSATKCPRCGSATYLATKLGEPQPISRPVTPPVATTTSGVDPSTKPGLDGLLFFLAITLSILGYGLLAPDSQFTDGRPRSRAIFLGVAGTITSILWYFFGSVNMRLAKQINKLINRIADRDVVDDGQRGPSSESEK